MWHKQVIAVLIIFSLALQSFRYYAVLADFYLNRDYIVKNICENRNKPQMHCNGKCHFKKQLQKEEQQQQQNNNRTNKGNSPVLFCNSIQVYVYPNSIILKSYSFYTSSLSSSFQLALLRPPCIS